jgi:hypothetical protein
MMKIYLQWSSVPLKKRTQLIAAPVPPEKQECGGVKRR